MGKEVAVEGCTLSLDVAGSASFTETPSTKVKAGGQFIYKNNTQVTVPIGASDGTCTTTSAGVGYMPATSLKNRVEGNTPLRVDDEVTIPLIPGVLSGGGACSLTVKVTITNAGQTKVLGE